jgi:hypothetical protein
MRCEFTDHMKQSLRPETRRGEEVRCRMSVGVRAFRYNDFDVPLGGNVVLLVVIRLESIGGDIGATSQIGTSGSK